MTKLLEEINRLEKGAWDNVALREMKYSREGNVCRIFFRYRPRAGQEIRDIETVALSVLPPEIQYVFFYGKVTDDPLEITTAGMRWLAEVQHLSLEDGAVTASGRTVRVALDDAETKYFEDLGLKEELSQFLAEEFCGEFEVVLTSKGSSVTAEDFLLEIAEQRAERMSETLGTNVRREIIPFNIQKYIGDVVEGAAAYIGDAKADAEAQVILCGKLSACGIREFESKSKPGKTFRIFEATLTDPTGSIKCSAFISDSTAKKYAEIDEKEMVVLAGFVEDNYQKNGLEFKLKRFSYCELPAEFHEAVYKKPIPKKYGRIAPKAFSAANQSNLWEVKDGDIPPFFRGKTFVVFDTETTGLSLSADRIIEIACVKIVDGRLTETMDTLVNPHMPIPEGASRVNHITDEMVADAPAWEEIVGDIARFMEGATLVGHNVSFDMGMLNNTARSTHYYFENNTMDTMQIARQKVKNQRNYTLANLLKTFGLVNENAHRAVEDAIATAQLFIKLIAM